MRSWAIMVADSWLDEPFSFGQTKYKELEKGHLKGCQSLAEHQRVFVYPFDLFFC